MRFIISILKKILRVINITIHWLLHDHAGIRDSQQKVLTRHYHGRRVTYNDIEPPRA